MANLCGVLMRFRLHKIAIIADIEKAYLQLQLNEEDRDVTRFLWIKDINKPFSKEKTTINWWTTYCQASVYPMVLDIVYKATSLFLC